MTYDLSRAHPNNPFRQPEFVPAREWVEDGYPVTGNRWLGFGPTTARVGTQVAHYQGSRYPAWKLSPAEVDVVRRLREFNRASWTTRGYAAYYSFDVPVDGRLWGLRAFDFRNAANADGNQADGNENDWTYSLHTIVQKLFADSSDTTVEPTWDQLETHRWLRWEAREYAIEEGNVLDFEVDLLGHRDLEPTGCPGDKFYAAIQSGKLSIPARTTTPVPEDDVEYRYKDDRYSNEWHLPFGTTYGGDEVSAQLATLPLRHGTHDQMLAGLCWTAWGCDVGTALARGLLV